MSDKEQLSPAERELETALRSLRPTPGRIDPAAAAHEARRRTARMRHHAWRVAAAAALIAVIGGTWFANRIARPTANSPSLTAAVIKEPVPQMTMVVYRQALSRSPADLEELLDRQATSASDQFVPVGTTTVWSASLRSLPGEI
jgi:hypothetical protein